MDLGDCELSSSRWWRPLAAPPPPPSCVVDATIHTQADHAVPGDPTCLAPQVRVLTGPEGGPWFPVLLNAGGCHPVFRAALGVLALWAGSSATHWEGFPNKKQDPTAYHFLLAGGLSWVPLL